MPSSSAPSSCSEMNPKKSTPDRHRKVNGRDRRVLMSPACARLLSEVSVRLGHRTIGQTIEWLIVQAKASVDAVIGNGSISSHPLPSSQLVMNTNILNLNVNLFPAKSSTYGFDFPVLGSNSAQIPFVSAADQHPTPPPLPISVDHGRIHHLYHQSDVNISPEMLDNFFS